MIRDKIIEAIQDITGFTGINLEVPENKEFGDYTTNIAFQIKTKKLKFKNTNKNAKWIVEKLSQDDKLASILEKVEIAGNGFINFYLKQEVLLKELSGILKKNEKYGSGDEGKGKTILVEYSSPNIAKHFGVGHLRSTIIGQAIYNLHTFLGYKVIGENHLGDWGTQFGALLYKVNKKDKVDKLSIDDLQKLYVEFNKEAEKKEGLWEEARDMFKKLEEGEPQARKNWNIIKKLSLREFERIYTRLGVKIDHDHGESFYEDKITSVLEELQKKGISKKGENGALIVPFENMPPAMAIKSDGTSTYFTRDLAALKYRVETWNPDILVYEVGSDQILHFRQVFETARLLGWSNDRQLTHVAHGLVRFKDGKMSTRKGRVVKLEDLLNEAVTRASKFNPDTEVSETVGIGAIKYFDLMHAPSSDIIFDWEKMFVLEGNSGPYLQYTYARIQSVLAKSSKLKAQSDLKFSALSVKLSSEESLILRNLIHFPEIIQTAAKNYSPNILCNYLFLLAKDFNAFYAKHKIIDSELDKNTSSFRLALTYATGQVLQNGLSLLGIKTPQRM